MKDRLQKVLENQPTHIRAGAMREFLQCMALRTLHEDHFIGKMAFIGGTALRLIYGLPRFSEDLDFSLIEKDAFDFKKIMSDINKSFLCAGINAEVVIKGKGAVQIAWLKFPKILHEMNISSDPRRVLSIKMEVDCNPPQGAVIEKRLVNRHFPLALVHYDLPSLFAGKLHAVLTRPYVKGRDYYDLVWYRTRHPDLIPNLALLKASLEQTKWKGKMPTDKTWRRTVAERISHVKWADIVRDVSPFLEDESDLKFMTPDYVLPLFDR